MTTRITCPGCGRRLLLPAAITAETLSCPRCLALIPNPQAPETSAAVQAQAPAVPPPPGAPSAVTERGEGEPICPACGKPIERGWRRCPYCEEPIRRRPVVEARDSLDDEVRRDSRGGIAVAVVLGVLVVLGVIVFLASGGPNLVSASQDGPAVFVIGVLVLGAILAGTIAVVATSKSKTTTALTAVFGGLFIGAGSVLLVVLLMCLAVFAAIANFRVTCDKCGK